MRRDTDDQDAVGVDLHPAPLSTAHGVVLDALRAFRSNVGRDEGRPAFSVLPKATVLDIIARKPANLGDLAAVPGMGSARLRRHGRRIVRRRQQSTG